MPSPDRARRVQIQGQSSIVRPAGGCSCARSRRAPTRLIMSVREKWWILFDIVLPLLGVCAYVFVYRANGAPAELIGFVIIGGAMSAYWMNVLWAMGNQLFWEKETGNLALYIMAPSSMMAILLGMALGGMFTTTLRALSILPIGGVLFDVSFAVVEHAAARRRVRARADARCTGWG